MAAKTYLLTIYRQNCQWKGHVMSPTCIKWYHEFMLPGKIFPETDLSLNSNFMKSRLLITYFSVVQSFWDCAWSTEVSLVCSIKNPKWLADCNIFYEWTRFYEICLEMSLGWGSSPQYTHKCCVPSDPRTLGDCHGIRIADHISPL